MIPSIIERAAAALLALMAAATVGAWIASEWYEPRLDAARAEARNLSDKIAEQNKAVRAMEEEADRREADAKARVAAAQAVARSAELSAQRLLSLALPQGADECAAARALIAREVRK